MPFYEESTDPLDYEALSVVAENYLGVLATGENLLSRHEAVNLARYGGLRSDRDVLQMDSALSYGFAEYQNAAAENDRDRSNSLSRVSRPPLARCSPTILSALSIPRQSLPWP